MLVPKVSDKVDLKLGRVKELVRFNLARSRANRRAIPVYYYWCGR